MKQRILWAVCAVLLSFKIAFGAEYTFEEISLAVPGYPGATVRLVDVTVKGIIVAEAGLPDGRYVTLIARANGRSSKYRVEIFDCSGSQYTLPEAINASYAVGNCDRGAFILSLRDGSYTLLSGVNKPEVRSISTENDVSGSFCLIDNPPLNAEGCTDHAFWWNPVTGYHFADFPLNPVTYPYLYWQQAMGRTAYGMTVGRYAAFNVATGVETNYWLCDNGQCSLPFPPPIDPNGSFTDLVKPNNLGQVLFFGFDYIPERREYLGKALLWDDDRIVRIDLPSGLILTDLSGFNEDGDFLGEYAKLVAIYPDGYHEYSFHNFIARQIQSVAKKKTY